MISAIARLGAALREDFRSCLDLDERGWLALRTAVAAVIAILLACLLQLENPWWAGITVLGVAQTRPRATLRRGLDRALGTIVGAVIGFLSVAFVYDHLLLLTILVTCTAFSIYSQERSDHGYALLLGGVTMMLVVFGSLSDPEQSYHLAVYRALEVLLGIAVSVGMEVTFAKREGAADPSAAKPGVFTRPVDLSLLSAALTGGCAIASIPLIWNALELPGLAQTPITAFVIVTALRNDPTTKGLNRLVGCILGGGFGLIAAALVGDAFFLWLVLLSIGLYGFSYMKNGAVDAQYAGHQAGVALILAMVEGSGPSSDIAPAIERLVGIFGGILVVALFQITVMPAIDRILAWIASNSEDVRAESGPQT
ncbi:FUSC family protein [Rhodoligotrophos defluvii]|uniref:FUSC family protein n=1 Tax=Rhodoligotrophos defluvii TaxID=2561934 RepID=UPI0010C9403C|nr:FUSC family protein [Rhodoligotrophos defluvii]